MGSHQLQASCILVITEYGTFRDSCGVWKVDPWWVLAWEVCPTRAQEVAGAAPGRACMLFVFLQVTGRAALQNTTLQSLGLTGGSATIR